MAVACRPDAAPLIWTSYVTGPDVPVEFEAWFVAPPHPIIALPSVHRPIRHNPKARRLLVNPRPHIVHASPTPESSWDRLRKAPVLFGVVIVRTVEAGAPFVLRVDGENAQLAPIGSPEQVNETAELNPNCGVAPTVIVVL